MTTQLEQAWEIAKQRYAAVGVDVEEALRQLDRLPVSMHCWQGDDVAGFENPAGSLTGGIQATGNYPGKARNAEELRADLEQALSLIPGPKRLNLHAIYLESDAPVARNEIKPEHFKNWVTWAKANKLGLDFNPSCFSHPLSADGFTLSHANDEIRQFWIDHCKASRRVSAYFGEQLGTPSVMNIWVPDGMKDITVDRFAPRQRLLQGIQRHIRLLLSLVQFLLPRGLARGQVSMVACLQQPLHVCIIDEAQFLTREQVYQLARVVDELEIPVIAYGLKSDFRGELFEGAYHLLCLADKVEELKSVCWCGSKAHMNARVSPAGEVVREGEQVEIGGNDRYVSLCRKHYLQGMVFPAQPMAVKVESV